MTKHNLMPKHGEQFKLLESDAYQKVKEIMRLQQDASLDLAAWISAGRWQDKSVHFPCKQCVLDIALQFEDLGKIIRELVE